MTDAEDILRSLQKHQDSFSENGKAEFQEFYDPKFDGEGNVKNIDINHYKLVGLLKKLGFIRLDVEKQSFIVRIVDNVAEECSQKEVIDISGYECISIQVNRWAE